jgi:hypothetical protein
MKNRLYAAAIVLGPLGLLLFFWLQPQVIKTPPPRNEPAQQVAVAKALAAQDPHTVAIIESNFEGIPHPARDQGAGAAATPSPSAGPSAPLEFTNFAAATVLQNMSRVVRQFGEAFGGNPVGNNAEITSQLTGQNPKHLNYVSTEAGLRVNGNGELVDPWGTPFFFHQISGREMEIHSAGPDRVMWTADDLMTK